MTTTTATYDAVGVPECTITKTVSATSGRKRFTVALDLQEINPVRGVTAEERSRGITSLNPPTVSADTPNALIRKAVVACSNAIHETEGFAMSGYLLIMLSFRVSHSVLQALRAIGEDV